MGIEYVNGDLRGFGSGELDNAKEFAEQLREPTGLPIRESEAKENVTSDSWTLNSDA